MPKTPQTETKSNSLVSEDYVSEVYYSNDLVSPLLHGVSCTFPDEFTSVAKIEEMSLEEIFGVFNRLDECLDPRVVEISGPIRSMCIGDVVVRPDGKNWVCINDGWETVSNGGCVVTNDKRYMLAAPLSSAWKKPRN